MHRLHRLGMNGCGRQTGARLPVCRRARYPQHRHQQQEPLRVAHPTAVATVGNSLEEAEQVIRSE